MARARNDRYDSVTELHADLRSFLEGRVVSAYRTGLWVEAKKWVARNRILSVSMLFAVIVLGTGVAATVSQYVRAEEHQAARASLSGSAFRLRTSQPASKRIRAAVAYRVNLKPRGLDR